MNHEKTGNLTGIVRGMIHGRAFENKTRVSGKGYTAALRQLHPGEEVFLAGAQNATRLARLVFGKGNYRTHRTPEGTYVAYTPHIDLERCPTCGAVRGTDHYALAGTPRSANEAKPSADIRSTPRLRGGFPRLL
jgi:hypothetical protein